jgi:hypothetical protein
MRNWSAEEQTMVDLMELNGCAIEADITRDYTRICLKKPPMLPPFQFTADTAHEALRKAFNYWTKHNA